MRTIEQVTDDEIVDAVASCGRLGLDTEDPWDGNAFQQITRELGLLPEDVFADLDEEGEEAESKLMQRMCAMPDRLVNPQGDRMHLTSAEWGRRLAGKSAEEIAKALGDFGETWTDGEDEPPGS